MKLVDNLQIYVVRHGERVDNCFGSDWLEHCFVHHNSNDQLNTPHSTYQRYDLNLPKQLPHRLPVRSLSDYEHDTPITELGTWQAANVGDALQGNRIEYVFCSPALRCVQTAHHIIQAIGLIPQNTSVATTNGTQQNGHAESSNKTFQGICVENALYEWTGWLGDYEHKWLTPTQLRANGLYVNTKYQPLSSTPDPDESQYDYYKRNGDLIERIIAMYGVQGVNRGSNILIVGHMPSLDACTYRLLTNEIAPRELEIEMGARSFLFSNYCGVAKVEYQNQQWRICNDQQYQQQNTVNEPFSFYAGWKSQLHHKYKQRHTVLPQLQTDVQSTAAARLPTLSFRRSFGFLLDQTYHSTVYLVNHYAKHNNSIDNRQLDQYITAELKPIEHRIIDLLPEWNTMKSYHNGYTARHTYRCFIAGNLVLGRFSEHTPSLLSQLSSVDQNVFSWTVLLHDLAKEVFLTADNIIIRDAPHPFKSGIIAAHVLARYGYCHHAADAQFKEWGELVMSALKPAHASLVRPDSHDTTHLIHDNTKIPQILSKLKQLFGSNTIAYTIVKLVLLHQSIDFLPQYPPGSPLSDQEVVQYLDHDTHFLHLLTLFTMVDSASYTLADLNLTKRNMQTIQGIGQKYFNMMKQRST